MNHDSIIYSAFRSLFKGFFWVIGFALALVIAIIIISAAVGAAATASTTSLDQTTSVTILPDSDGVRTSSNSLPVLLQLNINGIIGIDELTQDKIRTVLIESREGDLKDDRVKGVLLRIESPGGTVVDADGIYRAVKEYKERYKIPVIAYIDGLCASGGMYVACSADKIYASDASLVGSVGVIITSFLNFSQLLDKVGVQALTISAGKGKDDMDPLRPWKPGEEVNYRSICDYYYHYFVNIVTSNRPGLNKEKLVQEYGAYVFPATLAKEYGYIDGSGINESDVLKILASEAKIEGKYQVVSLESKTIWSQLFKADSPLLTGMIKHEVQIPSNMDLNLQGKFLYLYQPDSPY